MGPARPGLGPARPAMHLRTPSSTRPSHNSPIERHPCQIPLSQITYEPGPGVPVALVFAKRLAAHAHTPSPDPFLVSHATRIVPSVPGRKRGLHGRRVDSRERGAGSREQEAGSRAGAHPFRIPTRKRCEYSIGPAFGQRRVGASSCRAPATGGPLRPSRGLARGRPSPKGGGRGASAKMHPSAAGRGGKMSAAGRCQRREERCSVARPIDGADSG